MKLIGSLMKDARDRKGMTQEDLANAVDVSVPTIVRAENEGEIWPTTGKRLCDFLGVDLSKAVLPRTEERDGAA